MQSLSRLMCSNAITDLTWEEKGLGAAHRTHHVSAPPRSDSTSVKIDHCQDNFDINLKTSIESSHSFKTRFTTRLQHAYLSDHGSACQCVSDTLEVVSSTGCTLPISNETGQHDIPENSFLDNLYATGAEEGCIEAGQADKCVPSMPPEVIED